MTLLLGSVTTAVLLGLILGATWFQAIAWALIIGIVATMLAMLRRL
jgi:hypothetical protein